MPSLEEDMSGGKVVRVHLREVLQMIGSRNDDVSTRGNNTFYLIMTTTICLSSLPKDIHFLIGHHLGYDIRTLLVMRLTCKAWHKMMTISFECVFKPKGRRFDCASLVTIEKIVPGSFSGSILFNIY